MTDKIGRQTAPTAADIAALARKARANLPAPFRAAASDVALRVEDFATEQMLDALGIDDAYDLTGLYEGTPLTERGPSDAVPAADVIWLFRRPLLDEWAARGDVTLAALVTHVFVHELAHHLGWSDDDIAAIDQWWT